MERIGIYGGAYNPPHIGHMEGAKSALKALNLSKLFIIPTCESPHKMLPPNSATDAQRLEMLNLAFSDCPGICVSDMELNRGGTSYTVDTVSKLKEEYPDSELVLIMGTDMFLSFLSWRQPDVIMRKVSIGVLYRGEKNEESEIFQKKEELERLGATVYLVKNPVIMISSSDMRRMLSFDCGSSYLPQCVYSYITAHNLYGSNTIYKKLTQKQLEKEVIKLLNPNRVKHVLGCRDTAVELAAKNGENVENAARAALLHDITKALAEPFQREICRRFHVCQEEVSLENEKTIHALTGSVVAKEIFGENDAIASAIRTHTTGAADMTVLQKIIYVADYMEPNRDFPGVASLRELAYRDLHQAFWQGLEMTIRMLEQQGRTITPNSQAAMAYLYRKEDKIC